MAEKETVLAHTPTPGKKPVNVNKEKYDTIYDAIVRVLRKEESVEFKRLPGLVKDSLREPFDGSISWYTTTVKLDMEHRGLIERVPGARPQKLRLVRGR